MPKIKHTAIRPTELKRIRHYTDDPRLKYLWRLLAETGRRITEVIGRPPYIKLPGLRPIDIKEESVEDDLGNRIEWRILKKDADRKTGDIRNDFDLHTPQGRSEYKLYMREKRAEHDYTITELPISKSVLLNLYNLVEHYKTPDGERIFPYTYDQCRYFFQKACRKGKVYYSRTPTISKDKRNKGETLFHIHQLRHTYGTEMVKVAETPEELLQIQTLLQHEDLKTTQNYIDVDKSKARVLQDKTFKRKKW